jgi:zinc/manganese transport system substrate-binding protein
VPLGLAALAASALAGCGAAGSPASAGGRIVAVGAENEYANVIAQVGGRYVDALAVMSNPNTDPHEFEASPSTAREVAEARLVVQNGVGYDDFMNRIEDASPSSARTVVEAQRLLGLPDSTANPHLWYDPRTMPAVARSVAARLAAIQPAHAGYFRARAARFVASLAPWRRALAALHRRFPRAAVATTEPVADDLLAAARVRNLTPFSMQADIMNGIDPAPQAVSLQDRLLAEHRVRAFVINRQVTDSLTRDFEAAAARAHVPVVAVYETMPTPGYDYQSWMLAETRALARAFAGGGSTRDLLK